MAGELRTGRYDTEREASGLDRQDRLGRERTASERIGRIETTGRQHGKHSEEAFDVHGH